MASSSPFALPETTLWTLAGGPDACKTAMEEKIKALTPESGELPEEAKTLKRRVRNNGVPFVGWCAVSIMDSDGHVKQIKGSAVEAPVHSRISDDGNSILLESWFCPDDPLRYVEVPARDDSYVSCTLWFGSSHRGDGFSDQVVVRVVPQTCKRLLENAEGRNSQTLLMDGKVPFLPDPHANKCKAELDTHERKFLTRAVCVRVTLSKDQYEAWKNYHRALNGVKKMYDVEKEEDDKKKKDDNAATGSNDKTMKD